MKFTKIFTAILAAMVVLLFLPSAQAQRSGINTVISSAAAGTLTTNVYVVGNVTNQYGGPTAITNIYSTNLIATVGDYDYAGITWQFTGVTATTNGNVVLRVFRSYDNGVTYEYTPGYTYTVVTPTATTGAGLYIGSCTNIDLHGATHIAFTTVNLAASYITNESLVLNFKIPKVGSVNSTR